MNRSLLDEARVLWDSGRPLGAGELLYERLPVRHRPTWAANILDLCCGRLSGIPTAVDNVLTIVWDDACWPEAHTAFQAVRQLTLGSERSRSGNPVYTGLLYLAENTAKVTYNASGEPAPFDHDAGWRIAANLRHTEQSVGKCHNRGGSDVVSSCEASILASLIGLIGRNYETRIATCH